MTQQPECCATCRHIQRDCDYCHKRKEKRFNILGSKCAYWAIRWREGWKINELDRNFNPIS